MFQTVTMMVEIAVEMISTLAIAMIALAMRAHVKVTIIVLENIF